MAYPDPSLPTTHTPGTPMTGGVTDHASEHNSLAQAFIDLVAILGSNPQGNAGTLSAMWAIFGIKYITGGGMITPTTITAAQGLGYTGLFLDPQFVWTISSGGLSFKGIQDFTIESKMRASVGWSGNVQTQTGYINTGTSADGIMLFGDTGAECQGITFRELVFIGANTNAVIHNGGRARSIRFIDCFAQNTSHATGYAFITDAGLGTTAYNSEDLYSENLQLVAWIPLGLGINNPSQNDNDSLWINLTTYSQDGLGTFGPSAINAVAGTNHTFINAYDRSQPTLGTYTNSGAKMVFLGGEDDNQTGGPAHLISGSGQTIVQNRLVTGGTSAATISMSGGTFIMRGRSSFAGSPTLNITGGTADLNDSSLAGMNQLTISGNGGNLMLAPAYSNSGGAPTNTYTGNVLSALGSGTTSWNFADRTTAYTAAAGDYTKFTLSANVTVSLPVPTVGQADIMLEGTNLGTHALTIKNATANTTSTLWSAGVSYVNNSTAINITAGQVAHVIYDGVDDVYRILISPIEYASATGSQIFTSSGSYTPPAGTLLLRVVAIGGGGSGGGGGTAATTATVQNGGAGGGVGQYVDQIVAYTSGALTVTVPTAVSGGAGGATGGNPGIIGTVGGDTTVTGTGVSVTAKGGGAGAPSAASSATAVFGGRYGETGQSGVNLTGALGIGGASGTSGNSGGAGVGMTSGAGGAGGAAQTTGSFFGGGAGGPGTPTGGGGAGGQGNAGVVGGATASAAASTSYGAGGGGGGGANGASSGGTGGAGGPGWVFIMAVG